MKPIYISKTHEVIVESYLDLIFSSIREVVNDENKYRDFCDIAETIIEYHNQYSNEKNTGNFHDFMMIIPINFSTMVSGFLVGYENKENSAIVRINRALLSNFGVRTIEDLKSLKPIND